MEKIKILNVPIPPQACLDTVPHLIQGLGWQIVTADPVARFLWFRKGDNWLLQRRRDLWISLSDSGRGSTRMVLTIKDGRREGGESDPLERDLEMLAVYLKTQLVPVA